MAPRKARKRRGKKTPTVTITFDDNRSDTTSLDSRQGTSRRSRTRKPAYSDESSSSIEEEKPKHICYKPAESSLPIKRGIVVSDDDDIYDQPILPEAAVFTKCIEAHEKAIHDPSHYKNWLHTLEKQASEPKPESNGTDATLVQSSTKMKPVEIVQSLPTSTSVEICTIDDDDEDDGEVIFNGEFINSEITVIVEFRGEMLKFNMKLKDKFTVIFLELAKLLNVSPRKIMLCRNHELVLVDDTPSKVGYTGADYFECFIWANDCEATRSDDENFINVKFQSNDTNTKHTLKVHKLEPFTDVINKYSEIRHIPLQRIALYFDGEKIDPTYHSMELQIDEDNVVDVIITQ